MSFSNFLENELLDHVFGGGTRNYSPPTNVFTGLSTADPGDDGAGLAEPSGNGYARKQTAASDWSVASGGALSNANPITFDEATGSWGTVTHVCLFDQLTGGNLLASGALSASKAVGAGDTVQFAAGDLDVTLD